MTNQPSGPNDTTWQLKNTPHMGVATCYACGKPFKTEYDWMMRHSDPDDEDAVYHADCCPICEAAPNMRIVLVDWENAP